jgi:hypothetical protein
MTLAAQVLGERLMDSRVVLDDQNAHAGSRGLSL